MRCLPELGTVEEAQIRELSFPISMNALRRAVRCRRSEVNVRVGAPSKGNLTIWGLSDNGLATLNVDHEGNQEMAICMSFTDIVQTHSLRFLDVSLFRL
jgi:hypothetical protein